ncbi:MAG: phosphatidylserine/phosphatidylglycerophosphate/cardiolipin synthase family protein [Kiritimatiellia bacterium]
MFPMWTLPVGLGAKRVRIVIAWNPFENRLPRILPAPAVPRKHCKQHPFPLRINAIRTWIALYNQFFSPNLYEWFWHLASRISHLGIPGSCVVRGLLPFVFFLSSLLPFSSLAATSLDVRGVSVAFSPQGDSLSEIIRTLHSAKRRVDVAPFFLSHTDLIDTLCFLSARQKVKVRCFMDPASTAPAECHVLDRLVQNGVEVYVVQVPDGKMHLKCAVVDDDVVVTGAANWTARGFDNNVEDSLVVQSASLAQAYRARLDRLLPLSIPYHAPTGEEGPERIDSKPDGLPQGKPTTLAFAAPRLQRFGSIRTARVFFSADSAADNGLLASETIISNIQAAQERVDVAMYLLVEPSLIDALARKAAEGKVPVRLLVDSGMLDADSRSVLETLAAAGVQIDWLGSEKFSMHLKALVLDEIQVWTGSANWSQSAFAHNIEDLVLIESADLARAYTRHFDTLHAAATPFQPVALPVPAPSNAAAVAEFPMGLPPTGPRTNWPAGLQDVAGDDLLLSASARYVADGEYLPVLLDLIQNAHQSVLASMYVMGEPQKDQPNLDRLTTALSQAVQRGVYVHLLLHMPLPETVTMNRIHLDWAENLRAQGVDVRLHVPAVSLHEKVVVVDLAKVLIGSHNWSEGALSGQKVLESGVLIVLPRQDRRLADHVLNRESIRDMRAPAQWQEELRALRQLENASGKERDALLDRLDPEETP